MQPTAPQPVFLNLEYFFFLAYRAVARFFSFVFSTDFLYLLKILATILIILLVASIFYSLVRIHEMKAEDKAKAKKMIPAAVPAADASMPAAIDGGIPAPKQNETWRLIREKLLSDNPSDWKLAIIEADIYMERTLDSKGFVGETIGDKLKAITPEWLASVQVAWEAHKVRNRIAHDGADFVLTQPEARRVLSYYEIVFRDLGVID